MIAALTSKRLNFHVNLTTAVDKLEAATPSNYKDNKVFHKLEVRIIP
jgi:hypothetical protein